MTKPTIIHYVFARSWPLKGYLGAWAILAIVMVISVCEPNREMFKDWVFCVFFDVHRRNDAAIATELRGIDHHEALPRREPKFSICRPGG